MPEGTKDGHEPYRVTVVPATYPNGKPVPGEGDILFGPVRVATYRPIRDQASMVNIYDTHGALVTRAYEGRGAIIVATRRWLGVST